MAHTGQIQLREKRVRFATLVRSLATTSRPPFVLAEINDLLAALEEGELSVVTDLSPAAIIDEVRANQLAAMVETRAAKLGARPPSWVDEVKPLARPWFATDLISLRLHLLCHSPPAFRRRNLFVDSTVGDRV